jgi:hypothetical protein
VLSRRYIYSPIIIGSKLTGRQRAALMRCPLQSKGNLAEANSPDAVSGYQSLPNASVDLSVFRRPVSGTFQDQAPPDPTLDNHFIIIHGMDTFAAINCIASILEISCHQDTGFNICALPYTLPPAFVPTLQQQVIPHKPYVDLIPWPSVRDRILLSPTAINELELVTDIMSDGLKVWGWTPWDTMAWEVGPEFARKWWFLMDAEVIRTTNFWRGQRSEEPLTLVSS